MIITLLTDFGLQDPYVGIMKGVIFGLCPEVRIVDITHGIPPQDVRAAAFVLAESVRYFPAGTVHCAVVDPGVGSSRAVLAAEAGGHLFTAPDNGILDMVFEQHPDHRVHEITDPDCFLKKISQTFHGRDKFAPAAAHLALGRSPELMGPPVSDPVRLKVHRPAVETDKITGEIIYIDRFGNGVTNIGHDLIDSRGPVTVNTAGQSIPGPVNSYMDADRKSPLAIIGSFGRLEIAVREGNAAEQLGLKTGERVDVSFYGTSDES